MTLRVPASLVDALRQHAVQLTVQTGEPVTKAEAARQLLIGALERLGYAVEPPDPATQPRRGRPPTKAAAKATKPPATKRAAKRAK